MIALPRILVATFCLSVLAGSAQATSIFDSFPLFVRDKAYHLKNTTASGISWLTYMTTPGTPGHFSRMGGYQWVTQPSAPSNAAQIAFLPVGYPNKFLLFDMKSKGLVKVYPITPPVNQQAFAFRFPTFVTADSSGGETPLYVFEILHTADAGAIKIKATQTVAIGSQGDGYLSINNSSDPSAPFVTFVDDQDESVATIELTEATDVPVPTLPSTSTAASPSALPALTSCDSQYSAGTVLIDTALVPWFFVKTDLIAPNSYNQVVANPYYYIERWETPKSYAPLSLDSSNNHAGGDVQHTITKGFSATQTASVSETFGFNLTFGVEASAGLFGTGVKESFSIGLSFDLNMTQSYSQQQSAGESTTKTFHVDPCQTLVAIVPHNHFKLYDVTNSLVAEWDQGVVSGFDVVAKTYPNWCSTPTHCPNSCPAPTQAECLPPPGSGG